MRVSAEFAILAAYYLNLIIAAMRFMVDSQLQHVKWQKQFEARIYEIAI